MIYAPVPLLLPLLRGNTFTRFQTAAGPLPVHSKQEVWSFIILRINSRLTPGHKSVPFHVTVP